MDSSENIITYALFFVGILITLLIPLPIKEEYRLAIITMVFLTFLAIILSGFDKKLEDKDNQINGLNKRFKTIEELNEIRLNIKELQRKVFKNER